MHKQFVTEPLTRKAVAASNSASAGDWPAANGAYFWSPARYPFFPPSSHFPPSLFPFSLRLPHFTACAPPPQSPTPTPISPCVSSSFPFSRPICRSRSPFPASADLPSHPIFFSGVSSSPFPFPVARSSPSSVSPSRIVDGGIDSISSSLSGVDDNRFLVLPLRRNRYLFLPPPPSGAKCCNLFLSPCFRLIRDVVPCLTIFIDENATDSLLGYLHNMPYFLKDAPLGRREIEVLISSAICRNRF
ncbi:hypothetical protein ACLOJK_018401 [Asimina triloba]